MQKRLDMRGAHGSMQHMHGRILVRLTLALTMTSAILTPMGWAMMDRAAYTRMSTEEKTFINKLEKLPADVRLCMLAEQFSVVPTDASNYAVKPVKLTLPGGKQVDFNKVLAESIQKHNWEALWKELRGKHLMAVGEAYADDIAKLRKLNADKAKHARDIVAKFKKVDERALDAFFTEMYKWSEPKGNGTNQECKIYGSDHRKYRWGDLFHRCDSATWESLKPLWRGNKGLLEMEFASQISKLRKYNAKEEPKKDKGVTEKATTALSPKALASAVGAVQSGLKAMPESARPAFLAALEANVALQDLHLATYADGKGRLHSVFDELLTADAIKDALRLMRKAQQDPGIRAEVLDRNEKAMKSLEKGAEQRANEATAVQKAYEAKQAAREFEQMNRETQQDHKQIAEAAMNTVQQVPDQMCQEVIVRAMAHKFTTESLFAEFVYDAAGRALNCYDVLNAAGQVETAINLMLDASGCPELQKKAVELMVEEDAAHEKQTKKRAALINVALKEQEAADAQRALKKNSKK